VTILLELNELDDLPRPLCLVDARIEADYAAGHIPGAIHLDTFEFANEHTAGDELDEVRASWHEMFLQAGVQLSETVVFYDAGTENRGSRPAVMLQEIGHESVRVLHGGMAGWLDAGRPIDRDNVIRERSEWARRRNGMKSGVVVGRDAVVVDLTRPDVVLLDVRSASEFAGTREMQGNPRLGRLPSARHVEWTSLISRRSEWPDGTGTPRDGDTLLYRFHDRDEIVARLASVGIDQETDVLLYCQKSHRASVVYVALEALGMAKIRVYAGSFREWSRCADLPIER